MATSVESHREALAGRLIGSTFVLATGAALVFSQVRLRVEGDMGASLLAAGVALAAVALIGIYTTTLRL